MRKVPDSRKMSLMTSFWNTMIIQRGRYLKKLISWKHTDLIKIVTGIRHSGMEIHIYPLSFSELYRAVGGDRNVLWKQYYIYGALPYLASLDDNHGFFNRLFLQS